MSTSIARLSCLPLALFWGVWGVGVCVAPSGVVQGGCYAYAQSRFLFLIPPFLPRGLPPLYLRHAVFCFLSWGALSPPGFMVDIQLNEPAVTVHVRRRSTRVCECDNSMKCLFVLH